MEIEKLLSALEKTLSHMQRSASSEWASKSVDELSRELEMNIVAIRSSGNIDEGRLRFLFAPTAPIQEVAIDNGWGEDFLRLAEIVDQIIAEN